MHGNEKNIFLFFLDLLLSANPLSRVPAFASIPPCGRNALRAPFQSGVGFVWGRVGVSC